ncbi:DUF6250 domain-containing protein [Saccharicrinis fermentans]|uniref:DUF6250 domain-containing protein n=1 Tax=Saccharicrinis fermentans DSM 9555 = JCM 21142 TaxID=869213 RepID=W7YHD4_9BACT|nr:DUF6250 domain-containing protein [Saccharicrinis fermentans]GAF01994.1 hypothetical protein JCM21142_1619 [Saccharicrinis fermentans DSM 9555 = JCM 21142]
MNTLTVKTKLIVSDDFEAGIDHWSVEQMPGGKVFHNNGKLEIEDAKGCTVWYKYKQKGPIMIEYDTYVIKEDGPLDRASDLNCFWMANDPEYPSDFFKNGERRGGKFSNYDYLSLYYVGLGGHYNTKTRFRRYTGTGEKPLLPAHDLTDPKYLIKPNEVAKIRIIACDGIIQYYRNNELIFDYFDSDPYTSGYFGIRTVHNHMTVDNFKIYRLKVVK